jgi:hypothetical protein
MMIAVPQTLVGVGDREPGVKGLAPSAEVA